MNFSSEEFLAESKPKKKKTGAKKAKKNRRTTVTSSPTTIGQFSLITHTKRLCVMIFRAVSSFTNNAC